MDHPLITQMERYGELVHPQYLGRCTCGCGETITTGDAHIRWSDEYFMDRDCLMRYLKRNCDIEEVG